MDLYIGKKEVNMNNIYYKNNAKEFIDSTINCDMTYHYNLFYKYLPINSKNILDIGFGSGRDSLYFKEKYNVYSIDPVKEFCDYAKSLGLSNIYNTNIEDFNIDIKFDGIWACASLLHIKYDNLLFVFNKCYNLLNNDGIMYCSFKYGDFEGILNNRYFTYLNEDKLNNIIKYTNFKIEELSITSDVRDESKPKWLNIILKK